MIRNDLVNNDLNNRKVYLAEDIMRILGIGRSKTYEFLDEIYGKKDPPFKVLKIGKLIRVPKKSFDAWLYRAKEEGEE